MEPQRILVTPTFLSPRAYVESLTFMGSSNKALSPDVLGERKSLAIIFFVAIFRHLLALSEGSVSLLGLITWPGLLFHSLRRVGLLRIFPVPHCVKRRIVH